jgi:hypothetical protein
MPACADARREPQDGGDGVNCDLNADRLKTNDDEEGKRLEESVAKMATTVD